MSVPLQKFIGITLRGTLFFLVFLLLPGPAMAGRPCFPGGEPTRGHIGPDVSRINSVVPRPSPETNSELQDSLEDQKERGISGLREAGQSLSARHFLGWMVTFGLIVGGLGFLLFGRLAINAAFIPVAALIGLSLGAYLGINLDINSLNSAALPALIGAAVGAVSFGITAVKAPGVAWLLMGVAPFLALAAFLAPANRLVALLSVFAGLVLGLWTSLDTRTPAVISTAALGTIMLVFAWGILAHLLPDGHVASLFWQAAAHPSWLAVSMAVCLIVGADFQRLTSRQNRSMNRQGG